MALDTIYPYDVKELIDRAYTKLNEIKEENQKLKLPKMVVINKDHKTFLKDFEKICEAINRTTDEVKQFFYEELGGSIECSVNEAKSLVIKKIIKPPSKIKVGIYKYISLYVKCPQCNSYKTFVTKKRKNKYINCKSCSSVSLIN
jgi:translation initiation factor 2 beta subunit (eIF-2beta)/eIF-5